MHGLTPPLDGVVSVPIDADEVGLGGHQMVGAGDPDDVQIVVGVGPDGAAVKGYT
jgi:hypothetical protein